MATAFGSKQSTSGSAHKVFISYRRDDSAGHSGRIGDRLRGRFGSDAVFQDVDTIRAGEDFLQAISRGLDSCDVQLVVIGPDWLTIADPTGTPRIEDAQDPLVTEIATGLARPDFRVIPVLVGGAKMPRSEELPETLRALALRNGVEVRDTRWEDDLDRLIGQIDWVPPSSTERRRPRRAALALAGGALVAAGVATLGLLSLSSDPNPAVLGPSALPETVEASSTITPPTEADDDTPLIEGEVDELGPPASTIKATVNHLRTNQSRNTTTGRPTMATAEQAGVGEESTPTTTDETETGEESTANTADETETGTGEQSIPTTDETETGEQSTPTTDETDTGTGTGEQSTPTTVDENATGEGSTTTTEQEAGGNQTTTTAAQSEPSTGNEEAPSSGEQAAPAPQSPAPVASAGQDETQP